MVVEKVIECPCGAVLEGADDEALVFSAQSHAREIHQMELSAEQALSMTRPI